VDRPLTSARSALLACVATVGLGCATGRVPADVPPVRPFVFATDTFTFVNESHWIAVDDPAGGPRVWTEREVRFALHCAGVVRAARQFLVNARFDPTAAVVDEARYQALARAVLARDPRALGPREAPIVIPGYANLHAFSAAHEAMLRDELNADWRSVLPRGDWRIVVPFTPASQAATAAALFEEVRAGVPAIVRVFWFPVMTINHAILLFDAEERDGDLVFQAYDPNDASGAITLTFDTAGQTFMVPVRNYFDGGPVKVYEIYAGLLT
jgi:hypothetical protein